MKKLLTILALFLHVSLIANMASPIQEGSFFTSPFISKFVNILEETILVKPDLNFETAKFEIEYHIALEKESKQIPLLFYASEFKNDFKVWLDGQEIKLMKVPENYKKLEGSFFTDFDYLFESENNQEPKPLHIEESASSGFYVSINDLKFFEVNLIKGKHIIRVEYIAEKWVDRNNWIKEYSFRYILSPAKHWKSFGKLEITLDASSFDKTISSNLDDKQIDNGTNKFHWSFNKIPTETLKFSYIPRLNNFAKILLLFKPFWISIILLIILFLIHLFFLHKYHKKDNSKKKSLLFISGCISIPFLSLLGYVYAFDVIDFVIGEEASKFHGYTFLILFIYPVILLFYWLILSRFNNKFYQY